ncbi:hypothetical protein ARMGADRAFT_1039215 [Armillaria gallica]|uniref:Uncharacterized protein n=1 Tax=Armillaria gallica TaxID=47427 RepID=A0A2H3CXY1_ARMGA|nr:hypothetical protein ARMGADRAFT_1039215 [Armillaria gallica]
MAPVGFVQLLTAPLRRVMVPTSKSTFRANYVYACHRMSVFHILGGNISPILQTILLMNMFAAGTRVFVFSTTGELIRGVVESTSRTADFWSETLQGMVLVKIRRESGDIISLPHVLIIEL